MKLFVAYLEFTEIRLEKRKKENDIFVNSQVESNVIPPSDEALELMKYCVELIAYDHIDKASIVLPGAVKANISKKGAVIKVERAETIKSSKETL